MAVKRQTIRELDDTGVGQQTRTDVAAGNGRRRLLGRHDILLALRTGANLLDVFQLLQRAGDALQLIREFVGHRLGFDAAGRTGNFVGANAVVHGLDRQILGEDVLPVIPRLWFGRLLRWRVEYRCCWSRARIVVFFGCFAELAILALLVLLQKYVELVAQVLHLFIELTVALKRQLELLRKLRVEPIGFAELSVQSGILFTQTGELLVV